MRYIPNSPEERREMLRSVGLDSPEQLFSTIPSDILLKDLLRVPEALSEIELLARFESLAAQNSAATRPSFLGAGAYTHYQPTIIDSLIQRSEFFTAYTPYQPEVSQGTLQAIFEFQTLVCQLTGMEVANASMYDGSTALAEAVLMAERVTRRGKVIVSPAIHPEYLHVAQTYVEHAGVELARGGFDEAAGLSTFDDAAVDDECAAIVVQSPNFFGCVEDLAPLAERAHRAGALLVVCVTEAISLGLLKSPGACGADIVVAEGQSFGVPASFGGPYVGLFATREQHIRREKATSNICTNEGLIALAATIYMETMGRRGLQEVATQCAQKAAYAARRISEIEGFSLAYTAPRFNEFVVRAPVAAESLLERVAGEHNITGGLPLSRYFPERACDFLVCVTETNRRSEIDALVAALKELTA
ncbi:MAG: aminomethyl-transferring glycine dehydrogenase subunit GcvPA [Acidobacteriota bacterium]|nr:aminomethyl-transferring glycine dehydrogenase subunit GcvPA [Acidobacteriota bacterium]